MGLPQVNDWTPILEEAMDTTSYHHLKEFLIKEYTEHTIYPAKENIWQAFQLTPYEKVKVVILGQDPYHGPHQAHGLSFSVQPGIKVPPSLRNIYKELENDLGIPPATHGYLKNWALQGVFLLNTILTVRKGEAYSHKGKGWEEVTDHVIRKLNEREAPMVFILWGNASREKASFIDDTKHLVLTSTHPSPFSAHRGFFGSHPFSKANKALENWNDLPIQWQLPDNPER